MREAILYTRTDCHLCHRARAVLDAIASDYQLTVVECDVDTDPCLARSYGHRIPVVVIDGKVAAEGRVSEYRLRRRLGTEPSARHIFGLARAALRREID